MIAIGIDIGGTKCEVQLFNKDWSVRQKRRIPTAKNYANFLSDIVEQVSWADQFTDNPVPIGLSLAGLIDQRGFALSANLPLSGQPILENLRALLPGRTLHVVNDCRALVLSEAVFGAGMTARRSVGLVLGTGIGAGVIHQGQLLVGPAGTAGEFGHTTVSAHMLEKHKLPVLACSCGRIGCVESYCSGPGLSTLYKIHTGKDASALQITQRLTQDADADNVWNIWLEIMGELLIGIVHFLDPDLIILAGGLSNVPNITQDLENVLSASQFSNFAIPSVVLAQGGDASGARGAAYFSMQAS